MLTNYHFDGLRVAGCDEAGRGCLAGSVFAGAVILPSDYSNPRLNDSKKLTRRERDRLRDEIERDAVSWAVGEATAAEIDRINILQASILAMHRALTGLSLQPEAVIVDGNRFRPYNGLPFRTIVRGDATYLQIAAASILAKTYRDDYMERLATDYPAYGWERNKGYPTRQHREAIRLFGTTPLHRMTFNLTGDNEPELPFDSQ